MAALGLGRLNLKKRATPKPPPEAFSVVVDEPDALIASGDTPIPITAVQKPKPAAAAAAAVPAKNPLAAAKPAQPSSSAPPPAPKQQPSPAASESVPRKKKAKKEPVVVEEEESTTTHHDDGGEDATSQVDTDDEVGDDTGDEIADQLVSRLPMLKSDKDGVGDLINSLFHSIAATISQEHADAVKFVRDEEKHCYDNLDDKEARIKYKALKKRLREPSTMKLQPSAIDVLTVAANSLLQELTADLIPHGADAKLSHSTTKASELYIRSKTRNGVSPLTWTPAEQNHLFYLQTLEYAKNRAEKFFFEAGGVYESENKKEMKAQLRKVKDALSLRITAAVEAYNDRGHQETLGSEARDKKAMEDYEELTGAPKELRRRAHAIATYNMKTLADATTASLLSVRTEEKRAEEKRKAASKAKVEVMEAGKKKKKLKIIADAAAAAAAAATIAPEPIAPATTAEGKKKKGNAKKH